jgi:stage II sporulation protein AA (anti-sigma F factor antagonist)
MTSETDERLPMVLAPSGRLDAAAAPALRHTIADAMSDQAPLIIINMAGVSYVSSATLRVMLAAHKQAQRSGGRVVICCLQPHVEHVLHMVGFDQVLIVVDTEAEARSALRSFQGPTTAGKGQP